MPTLEPHTDLGICASAIEAYLRHRFGDRAVLIRLSELGQTTQESLKSYGYGRPLRIDFEVDGERRRLVLRSMTADPFGHERRADRVGALVQDFDTFPGMPRHIQPLAVGTFDEQGALVPMGRGEAWLLTDYVEGELYAHDLRELQGSKIASQQDLARARALATYAAEIHSDRGCHGEWDRSMRDTIGSGEGIFGLTDSYPLDHPIAATERLERIETLCLRWRWRWRREDVGVRRARRIHGDYHPFNILFRKGTDFTALDCSRGAFGEPADDVTCMSLNYLFFALAGGSECFDGALRQLWDAFFTTYLEASGDLELLNMVAPFYAWRGLVVASPVWYPGIADGVRERIFTFIERLLEGEAFHPSRIDALLEAR